VAFRHLLICLFLVTACALAGRALAQNAAPLSAEKERALKPKDTFQECTNCPLMKVVPAGSFNMGSPTSEPGHMGQEGPQHTVTIAQPFAVAQYELTFDEWEACAADAGCDEYRRSDEGWGRGRRPVINVSWDNASAYVAWLAKKTGKPYRLLSEAEYEYATRAGTTTAYPWSNAIGKNNANCDGCGSQWDGKQTAPVGSFAPNQFGLYDMVGNVWVWIEDCWQANYNGAPTDGSAREPNQGGNCDYRVMRGGSLYDNPSVLRSAQRNNYSSDSGFNRLGLRVGRTLLTSATAQPAPPAAPPAPPAPATPAVPSGNQCSEPATRFCKACNINCGVRRAFGGGSIATCSPGLDGQGTCAKETSCFCLPD
jgi:formylglycine-generating enzyme required for sulfatase activity